MITVRTSSEPGALHIALPGPSAFSQIRESLSRSQPDP